MTKTSAIHNANGWRRMTPYISSPTNNAATDRTTQPVVSILFHPRQSLLQLIELLPYYTKRFSGEGQSGHRLGSGLRGFID